MIPPNSAYQSPAAQQSAFDLTMDNQYMDPGVGMGMDYGESGLGNNSAHDVGQMSMYNQPQFNQSMVNSPMHTNGSQSTPQQGSVQMQDQRPSSGMNTQYSNMSTSSRGPMRHLSRSQSLHLPNNTASPGHSAAVTPMSQPASAHVPNPPTGGFQGQPQNPAPGSRQDVGMGNTGNLFDGVNGPVPVDTANYNPNNQGFKWEAPEGGWPSTMVGRPHTQTTYKNAYSSTGFDMLGVLVSSK
jgi:hypothetical protein